MNIAGLLVIGAGAFLLIVGLRGTQHAALPGLFPAPAATSASATPKPPTSIRQMPIVAS